MPYKEFKPKDTLEEALSMLWGAAQEFVPTTRMEQIICMIANAQPTGIHAVPDIEEGDTGKVLTASADGAVWASGGGSSNPIVVLTPDCEYVADPGGIKLTFHESFDEIVNMTQSSVVFIKFYDSGEGEAQFFIGYINNIYQYVEDGVTITELKAWQPDTTNFDSNVFEIYVDNNEVTAVITYA